MLISKKIKLIFPLLILTLIFGIFSACSPQYIHQGKKEIRSERSRINQLIPVLYSLDSANISAVLDSYFSEIDTINKYITPHFKDQSSPEWQYLTEFGLIKKALKNYKSDVPKMKKDALYSLNQLTNLNYDLKNKLINQEQYKLYISDEKRANDELIFKAKTTINNADLRLKTYYRLKPKMDSLVNIYKHQ